MAITPAQTIDMTLPAGIDKAVARPAADRLAVDRPAADAQPKPDNNQAALTRDDVQQVTDTMNNIMKVLDTDIQFSIHEKTQRLIVQVVDTRDHRVLKEFPPHELLDTLGAIRDYVGLLLDKKV